MNKKLILIIFAVIIIALGGYFIYNLYFLPRAANETVNLNLPVNNQPENFNAASGTEVPANNINSAPQEISVNISAEDKNDIAVLSKIFGQYYGSYSNQTNLENFDNLYDFMGQSMKNWVVNTYKADILKQYPRDTYYAVETKVIRVTITEIDETKNMVKALLNTQRREYKDSPDNFSDFSQDLLLNISKGNSGWIVESAYWQ